MMGNSSTKESRSTSISQSRTNHDIYPTTSVHAPRQQQSLGSDRHVASTSNRNRNGRHDVPFLNFGPEQSSLTPRRETKQEREARKLEKERIARLKERERSLKEESVDGGYLVTLGTYVGTEDFSKQIVRKLMIERRLAPFWRGLNDHSESWTEHQLVAAAHGLLIPAPDEIPSEEQAEQTLGFDKMTTQPISFRTRLSGEVDDERPMNLSKSHPTSTNTEASSVLFRGRSKTLASLTSSKLEPQTELIPQEVHLPKNPTVNGQRIEATLYKDVLECPICFLYYPPYLNRTRCCDQPICSECFVQIKRPNPHAPEHTDPNSPPPEESQRLITETQLVSEPATCPFCVQPELGITYRGPPFRRGLIYKGQLGPSDGEHNIVQAQEALFLQNSDSSHKTTASPASRRRGQSLSSSDPAVITVDQVRPDWFKKLSDARAHAARRSAAATALHSAAYMINGSERSGFGRRRRHIIRDTPSSSSDGTPRADDAISIPNIEALLAALEGQGSSRGNSRGTGDQSSSRAGTRGNRVEDLEEVMMMEAIRQSLAAEEERKKKAEKEAKKEEKKAAKEHKKADKTARKSSYSPNTSANVSGVLNSVDATPITSETPEATGKGKAKNITESTNEELLTGRAVNPLVEPTSTLNTEFRASCSTQQHIEQSRADQAPNVLETNRLGMQKEHMSVQQLELQPKSFASRPRSTSTMESHEETDNSQVAGPP